MIVPRQGPVHGFVIFRMNTPGMRRFPTTPRKKSRIEIIPMIDVMMFLLVFFVLLSINVIPALGLKLKLPVSSQVAENHPPVRVLISVPIQGNFLIDDKDYGDSGAMAIELLRRKKESVNGIAVIINGDEGAALQRLIDVMDILKSNGIEALTISAKRK